MNLNLGIIRSYLASSYKAVAVGYEDAELTLKRPMFFHSGCALSPGEFYVASWKDGEVPDTCACCFALVNCTAPYPVHFPAIIVEDIISPGELLNAIHKIFDFFDEWDKSLLTALTYKRGLEEIFVKSGELFRNPISFMNADFKIVCASGSALMGDISMPALDDGGFLPAELVNAFKLDKRYNEVRDLKEVFIFPSDILPVRTLCANIFDAGGFAARIVVFEYSRKFEPHDFKLLAHMALYVSEAYRAQAGISCESTSSLHKFIEEALRNDYIDTQRFLEELGGFGWRQKDDYVCVKIKPSQRDRHNLTLHYNCRQIEAKYQGACAIEYEGGIAAVFNLTRLGNSIDEFLAIFVYFVRESYFIIGYSRVFDDVLELANYYRQADIALRLGEKHAPAAWMHRFDSYVLGYLLQKCSEDLPPVLLCHEGLAKLRAIDEKQGSELYISLRNYLINDRNAVKTAKAMFIHRMTLVYRLDRIKALTSLSWDTAQEYLYLLLSILLLEV